MGPRGGSILEHFMVMLNLWLQGLKPVIQVGLCGTAEAVP